MLRGLTTTVVNAEDVAAAAAWYAEVVGTQPYFTRPEEGPPMYVEFRIGDRQTELGIMDSRFAVGGPLAAPSGPVTYWAVDDVEAAYRRLLDLGASEHEPPTPRGEGFVTASVVDPFGNLLGVMFNQHYFDVLGEPA